MTSCIIYDSVVTELFPGVRHVVIVIGVQIVVDISARSNKNRKYYKPPVGEDHRIIRKYHAGQDDYQKKILKSCW